MEELWMDLQASLGLCSNRGLGGDFNIICWVWKLSRTAELEVRRCWITSTRYSPNNCEDAKNKPIGVNMHKDHNYKWDWYATSAPSESKKFNLIPETKKNLEFLVFIIKSDSVACFFELDFKSVFNLLQVLSNLVPRSTWNYDNKLQNRRKDILLLKSLKNISM